MIHINHWTTLSKVIEHGIHNCIL